MRLLLAAVGLFPLAFVLAVTATCPAHAGSALELQAKGVQIYTCGVDGPAPAWRLRAPDATLFDARGQVAGRHFAGPSWQAGDGSIVVGEVVASGTGAPGAVPWLVLRAKSHSGNGVFAGIGYVVRSRTAGGDAPAAGCDRDHAGAEARVDYTASYTFFPAAAPQ